MTRLPNLFSLDSNRKPIPTSDRNLPAETWRGTYDVQINNDQHIDLEVKITGIFPAGTPIATIDDELRDQLILGTYSEHPLAEIIDAWEIEQIN